MKIMRLKYWSILLLGALFTGCLGGNRELKYAESTKLLPLTFPGENILFPYVSYVDEQGKRAFDGQFKNGGLFSDGLALVHIKSSTDENYINEKGEVVIDGSAYEEAGGFWEGIAWVKKLGTAGPYVAINTKGEELFALSGEPRSLFHNGLALFEDNYKYGIINVKGEVVRMLDGYGILPQMIYAGRIIVNKDRKFGAIDTEGNLVIGYLYDYIDGFDINNCAVVKVGQKYGLIDASGKVLIEPCYEGLHCDGDRYRFKMEGKYGWCNKKGKVLIEPVFELNEHTDFFMGNEYAGVRKDGEHCIIDRKGKVVATTQYIVLGPLCAGGKLAVVRDQKYRCGLLDWKQNKMINKEPIVYSDRKGYLFLLETWLLGEAAKGWPFVSVR